MINLNIRRFEKQLASIHRQCCSKRDRDGFKFLFEITRRRSPHKAKILRSSQVRSDAYEFIQTFESLDEMPKMRVHTSTHMDVSGSRPWESRRLSSEILRMGALDALCRRHETSDYPKARHSVSWFVTIYTLRRASYLWKLKLHRQPCRHEGLVFLH